MRHFIQSALRLLLLAFVLAQSCGTGGTYVVLTLDAGSLTLAGVTRVDVELKLGDRMDKTALEPGGEISFPTTATLDLGSAEGMLRVEVSAKDPAGKELGFGSGTVDVVAGKTSAMSLHLGPDAKLEITPSAKELGPIPTGGSAEAVFQIQNAGVRATGDLTVTLTGQDFVLTSNGCSGALLPGASCTVKVELQPTTEGNRSGKLTVSANPGRTAEATLNGIGNRVLWAKRFGKTGAVYGTAVAVDGSGNVVIAGYFNGSADFGGGVLHNMGAYDTFLAKYDANGTHLWSKRLGGDGYDHAFAVGLDRNGNVLVAGFFDGNADFGGGMLPTSEGVDVFVAKYDGNGNHVWASRFGGLGAEYAEALAVDGSGNVLIAGYYEGQPNFGGGALPISEGVDIFVAKYGPSGNHLWSKRHGGTNNDYARAIAVDGSGNVLVTGEFSGMASFGGRILTSASGGADLDVFVAKYAANGTPLWSNPFGGTQNDRARAMAVDGSGNVRVVGEFSGTASFGGQTLSGEGDNELFVAAYDANGAHLWSNSFGGIDPVYSKTIAVDGSGNALIAGHFNLTADLGGDVLITRGSDDIFVAKYDVNGRPLWSKSFGGGAVDSGLAAAVDGSGRVLVTGRFTGTVDFGGGPLIVEGSSDGFLLKLAP
jgi:hypothetical protein